MKDDNNELIFEALDNLATILQTAVDFMIDIENRLILLEELQNN